jgi:glycosyltransferase involved in cell wall biosynthesis
MFRTALEQSGIETCSGVPNDPAFDELLCVRSPDVVIFDRFMTEEQFSWRVRLHAPKAMRVLDTVDLHSLRRLRQRMVKENFHPSDHLDTIDTSDDTLRELAAIWRSDLTLITSTSELSLLQDRYGVSSELLALSSFGYAAPPVAPLFAERRDVVFIGNFNHKPNADAVQYLRDELWPRIQSASRRAGADDFELHIYGAYIPPHMQASDNPVNGFRIKGWVSDAHAVLARYRVNLAPLRFGAGIKGKISDGWYVGTPCVGTSCAAEGMHGEQEFGGIVIDDPLEFAEAVVRLYTDENLWTQASRHGSSIIRILFSAEEHERSFLGILEQAHMQLDRRRAANFIGTLLWYESNRSTEYFSRWIECKNNK